MKYAYILTVVALAIGVAIFCAYRLLRPVSKSNGGFRDWVKNPEYKQAAAEHFAARKSLTVPDNISDTEIRQMVDRLFVQRDDDFNFDRLKLVGAKATPFLIEALENPKTAQIEFSEGGHALDAKSPFERICDLLEVVGHPNAVPPLAKYVSHEDDHFRKHAALALGSIGTSECISPMLKALSDDDDYVRSYAMMGIQRGMDAKRTCDEFLDGVFPALEELLNREDRSVSGTAPRLLLAIDIDRAVRVLLSDQYFTVENPELHYIIRAMNAADQKIPHSVLLPLLKAVRPLGDKYPHDYEYAGALIAYARNPDGSAEPTFHAELESTSDKVREAAAEALAILSGVTNARDVVFDRVDRSGFHALSHAQKHYFAVFIYDGEVNNGGHSQYFVNTSGSHWKYAIDGLTAIGANGRANILKNASALFGKNGPSEDDAVRHTQIARFNTRQEKTLDGLDDQYYASKENIDVLLAQYALKHKNDFTTKK